VQKDDEFRITINDSNMPILRINQTYQAMLDKKDLDPKTKDFLKEKLTWKNILAVVIILLSIAYATFA